VVLGVLFADAIETDLRHLYITAVTLALFGVLLGWADKRGAKVRDVDSLSLKDAVFLGLAQAAALIPGVSRAGGTITAGLLLGLTREAAARYSFLLAIPAIIGSASFELATNHQEITAVGGPGVGATIIATVVAAGVGYFVIIAFLHLVSTRSYMPFVWYRIALGVAIAVLVAVGLVPALGAQ
ncbi:MAG: undecaprenyl-diphosphate phosphatase, partial [Demequina sp.]